MRRRRGFFQILAAVAAAEFLVMMVLEYLGTPDGIGKSLLDAFLLTVVLTPVVYLLLDKLVYERLAERLDLHHGAKTVEDAISQLAAIVEYSDDAIIGKTPEGVITSWNRGAERLFGYTAGEMIGRNCRILLPPGSCDEFPQIVAGIDRGERIANHETVRMAKGGRPVELSLTLSPIRDSSGRIVGVSTIARDIALRKQAETQIRKSLATVSALRNIDLKILSGANVRETLEVACDAIMEMGYRRCWVGRAEPDFTVKAVASRGFEEGYLDSLGIRWDDTPEGTGPSGSAIRSGKPCVVRKIEEDDRFAPWREQVLKRGYRSAAAVPLKSAGDRAIGCFNVYSEQEDAFGPENLYDLETFAQQCAIALESATRLEEIRNAHQRLSFYARRLPMGFIVWDREFRVVEWNPASEAIFGWSAEEAAGRTGFELFVAPEAAPQVAGAFAKLLDGDETIESLRSNVRKDGTAITCEWFSAPLRDAEGRITGVLSLVHDVTEKSRLEKQIQTMQRVESVGILAGGIAHDFNNALTGVIGFGEALRSKIAANAEASSDLNEILRCAERASTLTRQLLAFARRQVMEPKNVSLNHVVSDLEKFIRKALGAHIETEVLLAGDLPAVFADRGQIEQVLTNLCLNARDAMPGGGRMRIETSVTSVDKDYVRSYPYMGVGRYAVLTVTDTGTGMDEETRRRVFDPFFTTKDAGKGTGLGLAMVYGIVKQHNGYINLDSEPGKGTTFRIFFPAVDAGPVSATAARQEPLRGGGETLLLVEDDDAIRTLAVRALRGFGYVVLSAQDGQEGVEIHLRHKEEIALALLDVQMPRMGGIQAMEEMRKASPGLNAIFLSGGSEEALQELLVPSGAACFLSKPFTPAALAGKVREALDRSNGLAERQESPMPRR